MKLRLLILAAICAAGLAVPVAAQADTSPVYYVALGDSLATGAQPAPSGELNGLNAANGTNRGYVDELYAAERAEVPNLRLRNFGCGGESTQTMINGGAPFDLRCGYKTGSQLDQAVAFLQAHRGQLACITIDVGANDLISGGGVPAIAANLPGHPRPPAGRGRTGCPDRRHELLRPVPRAAMVLDPRPGSTSGRCDERRRIGRLLRQPVCGRG